MIGLVLIAAVLGGGCLFIAPPPEARPGAFRERTVMLSLEGTPGTPFEGSYGTPSQTTSARGTVPAEFTVRTSVAVVASFAKGTVEGELVVRLIVDGQEVQRRSTSSPYGIVIVNQTFAP
jgi:hypothetical protein